MDTISWDDLRVLLAVHRAGSLLAAGRLLGLSTSTTSRRLDLLESALGVRLVSRSRAGTALEPAALRLVRLAEEMEHGLEAERRDRKLHGGTVRVSVPTGAAHVVTKALLELRHVHPNIDFEVIGENQLADIANREADIGIRLVRSASSVLVEKHLATLRFGLYASAEYVGRYLPARSLAKVDVAKQAFVGLDLRWKNLPHEQWLTSLGAVRFPFRSSAMEAIVEAARQGVGIAALVEHDARSAGLVRIAAPTPGPSQPVYLVYHHELRSSAHVRAAVAAIEAYLVRQDGMPRA